MTISKCRSTTDDQKNISFISKFYRVAAKPKKTTAAKAAAETCRSDEPAETVWEVDVALELEVPDLFSPELEEPVAVAVTKPVLDAEPLVEVPVADSEVVVEDLISKKYVINDAAN